MRGVKEFPLHCLLTVTNVDIKLDVFLLITRRLVWPTNGKVDAVIVPHPFGGTKQFSYIVCDFREWCQ